MTPIDWVCVASIAMNVVCILALGNYGRQRQRLEYREELFGRALAEIVSIAPTEQAAHRMQRIAMYALDGGRDDE